MPLQQMAAEGDGSGHFGNGSKPLGETRANGTTLEAVAAPSLRKSFMIPGKSRARMGKAVGSNACA
jgi:hypothetical protein